MSARQPVRKGRPTSVSGLAKGRPFRSPRRICFERLGSPGTKLYTRAEAGRMLEPIGFRDAKVEPKLSPGDLLAIKPSNKYRSPAYAAIQGLYPRWFVHLLGDRFGFHLTITATKPV